MISAGAHLLAPRAAEEGGGDAGPARAPVDGRTRPSGRWRPACVSATSSPGRGRVRLSTRPRRRVRQAYNTR